ncbi:MAG TPA: FtsX-like permease family protein [Methylococcaceae bacterium]|nr:FtsX-like permease family protein [Methylococcaceae bacterium]
MSLFRTANRRFLYRHPLHGLLAVLGIVLGVAVLSGIDLSIASVRRAFELSMERVSGPVDHHIVAASGTLDEDLYVKLRIEQRFAAIAPVVEGYVVHRDRTLRLLGLDPFAEKTLRGRFEHAGVADLTPLLTERDTVLLSRASADVFGLHPGDRLDLLIAGRTRTVKIVDFIEGPDTADPALEGLLLADVATAQELLQRVGRLDRIDVRLGDDAAAKARLRNALPAGVVLRSAEGQGGAMARMTEAFATNLQALSALALLVGMFIIYNSMSFNLLRRRPLLASLRLLGVTRGELLGEVLWEAAALGLLGSLLGAGVGLLAAQGLLHLVTRTINDVYFVLTVNHLFVSPWMLAKAIVLGVAAAVLAALPPALEAAWSPPAAATRRSLLETHARALAPWLAAGGAVVMAVSFGLLQRPSANLAVATAAVLGLPLGYSLLTPLLLAVLAGAGARMCSRLLLVRLALRGIAASLSRTGVAAAALTLCIAVGIGVGVMIYSFRLAVTSWLEEIIQADIYVSLPSAPGQPSPPLAPSLVEKARALPGVARVGTSLRTFVETDRGRSELLALEPAYPERPPFRFKDELCFPPLRKGGNESGDKVAATFTCDGATWQDFLNQNAVLVAESYAARHGLEPGDRLELHTAQGAVSLPILGVFYDYRSDQGIVLMHRRLYQRLWRDAAVSSVGLYLAPGANPEEVKEAVYRQLAAGRQLLVRSSREIRRATLEVFERTFTVTQVLRLQALAVAFVGILGAFLALQSERGKELATLRALGFTPGQVRAGVLLQTGFLGLASGLLALPLGALVGFALVRVVNQRSFGWSMDLALPAGVFGEAALLAVAAALLAGVYPAWRAARLSPAGALREE